jgi:hypothetical protein
MELSNLPHGVYYIGIRETDIRHSDTIVNFWYAYKLQPVKSDLFNSLCIELSIRYTKQ